jgi:hypothetical protein
MAREMVLAPDWGVSAMVHVHVGAGPIQVCQLSPNGATIGRSGVAIRLVALMIEATTPKIVSIVIMPTIPSVAMEASTMIVDMEAFTVVREADSATPSRLCW